MEPILDNLPFIAGAAVLVLFVLVFRLLISSGRREKGLKKTSAVLENASVFVHAIRPTEPPDTAFDDGEEAAARRRYYSVDVTITPARAAVPGSGPADPSRWNPFDLDTKDPDSDPDALEESCELFGVEVWRDGQFVTQYDILDQEPEVEGAQRVRLRVGALPGARRFVFVYYLQEFGEVRLP
jgi:hypothetical protein